MDPEKLKEKIINVEYNEDINVSRDFQLLISNLLKRDPDQRLNYSDIRKLGFLKDHFNAYENGTLLQL